MASGPPKVWKLATNELEYQKVSTLGGGGALSGENPRFHVIISTLPLLYIVY